MRKIVIFAHQKDNVKVNYYLLNISDGIIEKLDPGYWRLNNLSAEIIECYNR